MNDQCICSECKVRTGERRVGKEGVSEKTTRQVPMILGVDCGEGSRKIKRQKEASGLGEGPPRETISKSLGEPSAH